MAKMDGDRLFNTDSTLQLLLLGIFAFPYALFYFSFFFIIFFRIEEKTRLEQHRCCAVCSGANQV
jgi:hypothetical protein